MTRRIEHLELMCFLPNRLRPIDSGRMACTGPINQRKQVGKTMSRRAWLLLHFGRLPCCKLCNSPVGKGEAALLLYRAPMPPQEVMVNFDGMYCHERCWGKWPLRDCFVAAFNRHASDSRILSNGTMEWLLTDGTVGRSESCLIDAATGITKS
jgi:hypothetical protein